MFAILKSLNYPRELVLTLYKSKLGTIGSNLIMPLLYVVVYWEFIPYDILLIWLGFHIIIFSYRIYIGIQYTKQFESFNKLQLKRSLFIYLSTIFAGSFLWGISSIFVIEYAHEPLYLFMFFIMLSGMASASIPILSSVYHSVFIFIANMFFISAVVFIYKGYNQLDYFLAFSFGMYFVFTIISSYKNYLSMATSIEQKNEISTLNSALEDHYKILQEKADDLEETKKEIEQILESILLPVIITDKESRNIVYANKYAAIQYGTDLDKIIGSAIQNVYTTKEQGDALRKQMEEKGYIKGIEQSFLTHSGKEFTAILSVIPINYKNRASYIGMTTDITKQKRIEEQIRQMHKHTQDSIKYASMIQTTLIPTNDHFEHIFEDYFTYWQPKDIVGGDIYLFEQFNSDESLLLVIDCTGHGVPGAFVTMLVKAVQVQMSSLLYNNTYIQIDPSWILSYFNKTIKTLLKQDNKDAISNVGFDGAAFYYNKKTKTVKYAGANTPLFYTEGTSEIKTLKTDKHSIGYKSSDINYEFTTHTFEVTNQMQFYITTDGFLDQNGGEKDFPYGKKRFVNLLEKNLQKPMQEQLKTIKESLHEYQGQNERNDDITVIGIKI